jgi:phage recombination protein Bet
MTKTDTEQPYELHPVVVDRDEGGLQVFDTQHTFLMKKHVPEANDHEIQEHLMMARMLDLNPFTGQIWLVPRDGNTHKTEIGIAGFRDVADRTGMYTGRTDPEYLDAEHNWLPIWLDTQNPPLAARVYVHRADREIPTIGQVTWSEAAQYKRSGGLTKFWAIDGRGPYMLAKCAEVQALRAAFPNFLSGVYLRGEIQEQPARIEQVSATRVPLIGPKVKQDWDRITKAVVAMGKPGSAAWKTTVKLQLAERGTPVDKLVPANLNEDTAAFVADSAETWLSRPFDADSEDNGEEE